MNNRNWRNVLQVLAMFTGVGLFFISAYFSIQGFNFNQPDTIWLGVILALAITVFELVLSEKDAQHNLTLLVVGIIAYLYGIITNVYGIWLAQGQPDYASKPYMLIFPIILGLLLEISPEPLLLWGLGVSARDLFGSLINTFGKNETVFADDHNFQHNQTYNRADQAQRRYKEEQRRKDEQRRRDEQSERDRNKNKNRVGRPSKEELARRNQERNGDW
jgi:hypothetical protein